MPLLPRLSSPKMLFIDFDGVLTPISKEYTGKTPVLDEKAAIRLKRLVKEGFKISIISARPAQEIIESSVLRTLESHGLASKIRFYSSRGTERIVRGKRVKVNPETGKAIKKPGIMGGTESEFEERWLVEEKMPYVVGEFLLKKNRVEKFLKKFLKERNIKLTGLIKATENQPNLFLRFKNPDKKELNKVVSELRQLFRTAIGRGSKYKTHAMKLKEIYPHALMVTVYPDGISVYPPSLGKHLGVLRGFAGYKVPMEKRIGRFVVLNAARIQGLAIGDSKEDLNMKIRGDIKFLRVRNLEDFLEKTKNLSQYFMERKKKRRASGLKWKLRRLAWGTHFSPNRIDLRVGRTIARGLIKTKKRLKTNKKAK